MDEARRRVIRLHDGALAMAEAIAPPDGRTGEDLHQALAELTQRARDLADAALQLSEQIALSAPATPSKAPARDAQTHGRAVFRRGWECWTVVYEDNTSKLQHSIGLTYVAYLLGRPGERITALELATEARRLPATVTPIRRDRADHTELVGYRARINDLRAELHAAEAFNDVELASRVRLQIESLQQDALRKVGFGKHSERNGSAGERARVNVTRAIASALRRVRAVSPLLAAHLSATIRTGTLCGYLPDPRSRLEWEL